MVGALKHVLQTHIPRVHNVAPATDELEVAQRLHVAQRKGQRARLLDQQPRRFSRLVRSFQVLHVKHMNVPVLHLLRLIHLLLLLLGGRIVLRRQVAHIVIVARRQAQHDDEAQGVRSDRVGLGTAQCW